MKFLPFMDLLDSEPAHIAVFSTYQLDPDYFERQLLRCTALAKARRILVFLDASQWYNLLRQDTPSRSLNVRYLVVPVRRSKGVFHPKLNLLLSEGNGQVQCGSNNLTRSGCSSNLELLNTFAFGGEYAHEDATRVAQEAFGFFLRTCDDAEEEPGAIARKWLQEAATDFPWLTELPAGPESRRVRLLHTYEGSLWDRLAAIVDKAVPSRLLIISPFHDQDCQLFKRIAKRWPRCQVEVLAQQQITTIPVKTLAEFKDTVSLAELCNSKRRLHAKLIAWISDNATGCLVGSANFTTAAFDARNVETCLVVSDAADYIASLFDKDLPKRPIAFEKFEPGTEQEPGATETPAPLLRITSALLLEDGQLRVSYRSQLPEKPSTLRVAVRTPGEPYPRAFASVPIKDAATATVSIPTGVLSDVRGTILAYMVAELGNRQEESAPVWVIQEHHLTHEPGGEGSSSAERRVRETGEGLTEILEEIGKRDGVAAVVEYLRHTDIRFNDGSGGFGMGRKFRLRIHDPFHPDVAPEWLVSLGVETDTLAAALHDFVERHEKRRLRKHARRGNINGMENFLDIFTALVRLLYVYYVRSMKLKETQAVAQGKGSGTYSDSKTKDKHVVTRGQLIGSVHRFMEVATSGIDTDDDYCEGYLLSIADNLKNAQLLGEVCRSLNFAGQVRAALMIIQKVRFVPNEELPYGPSPKSPRECLSTLSRVVRDAFVKVSLSEPSDQEIMTALEHYRMFDEKELAEFQNELRRR